MCIDCRDSTYSSGYGAHSTHVSDGVAESRTITPGSNHAYHMRSPLHHSLDRKSLRRGFDSVPGVAVPPATFTSGDERERRAIVEEAACC